MKLKKKAYRDANNISVELSIEGQLGLFTWCENYSTFVGSGNNRAKPVSDLRLARFIGITDESHTDEISAAA